MDAREKIANLENKGLTNYLDSTISFQEFLDEMIKGRKEIQNEASND